MPEVKTRPKLFWDELNNEYEAFGDEHTLADITRWLLNNKEDAKEIYRMLGEELYGTTS